MKEKIFDIIERYEEDGDLECHIEIEQLLKDNGIEIFKVSVDEMFDSPGYDVWSVSVAWIKNGILELAVGSIGIG